MIASLMGTIAEIEAQAVVVDVGGVGYRVKVLGTVLRVAKLGGILTLRIHHHISDSSQDLYGFATQQDVVYFELLLKVPSVGPRTAMSILNDAPPQVLAQAVVTKDIKLLTKVSGVGRKTAERILIELAGKFADVPVSGMVADVSSETISALMHLGYTKAQALDVLQQLPEGITTVEEAVKAVLSKQNASL